MSGTGGQLLVRKGGMGKSGLLCHERGVGRLGLCVGGGLCLDVRLCVRLSLGLHAGLGMYVGGQRPLRGRRGLPRNNLAVQGKRLGRGLRLCWAL